MVISTANLFQHMKEEHHRGYRVFSFDMSFYNMREIIVSDLHEEVEVISTVIGRLLDEFQISRAFIPNLSVSAPLRKNDGATCILNTGE